MKGRAAAAGAIAVALVPSSALGGPGTVSVGCAAGTGDAAALVAAIGQADSGAGPSTIALTGGCSYVLTAVNNDWYGPNGLPPISTAITIEGNGASIVRQSSQGHESLSLHRAAGRAQARTGAVPARRNRGCARPEGSPGDDHVPDHRLNRQEVSDEI